MAGFGLNGGGGGSNIPAQTAAQVTDHESRLNAIENLINFANANATVDSVKELWNAFVGFVEGDTVVDVLNLKVNKIDIADNTATNDATKVASARVAYQLELTKANRPVGTITPNDVLLVDANGDLIDSGYGLTNDNLLPDNKLALTQAVKNFLIANYQPLDEHLTAISDTTPSDKYVVIYDQTAGKYIARQGVISDIVNLQTELDKKADKIIGGTDGNVVTRDANGNIVDSGLGKTADDTLADNNLARSQDVKAHVLNRETAIRTDLGVDIATVNTNRQNQTNAVDLDLQTYKGTNDIEVAKKSNKVLLPNVDEFLLSDANGDLKKGSGIKSGGAGILEVPNLAVDPSTPNVGKTFLYNKNGRTYQRDDQGVISALGGNLTPAEIKDLYESNDDRNGYVDADKLKVDTLSDTLINTIYSDGTFKPFVDIDLQDLDTKYYMYKVILTNIQIDSTAKNLFMVALNENKTYLGSIHDWTNYGVSVGEGDANGVYNAFSARNYGNNVPSVYLAIQDGVVPGWTMLYPNTNGMSNTLEMDILGNPRESNTQLYIESKFRYMNSSANMSYVDTKAQIKGGATARYLRIRSCNGGDNGANPSGNFTCDITIRKILRTVPKPPAPNKYIYAAQAAPKYALIGSPKYAV